MVSNGLKTRELCILALLGAMMFASKLALASLPNVHLNAVLIILSAVFFGWRAMYAVGVYILLEGICFGFGLWWLSYLYIWPALAAVAVLMRKNDSALLWALVAGIHGLLFGAGCALPYLFVGGWQMAFSYWISGLPYDLIHCAGSFTLTLALFRPLRCALSAAMKHERTE